MIPDNEGQGWQDEGAVEEIQEPCVPLGYSLRAAPAPLISVNDGRWIARASYDESGEEGILIYEDAQAMLFLTADEVAMQIAYLMREAWNLIPEVDTTLSEAHTRAIEVMRSLWWFEETRKARAVVLSPQEEAHV